MPKIGLVTVLFKSDDVLEGFFRSLSAQTFIDYHLYIIDNSPSPKTDAILQKLGLIYPIGPSTHLRNDENVGVARGNNQGIQKSLEAGCSHILLLNNDIEFEQQSLLNEIYSHAVANKEEIIVPKIYFYDTGKIWLAGGWFSRWKGVAYHVGIGDADSPKYDVQRYFEYAPTCFMLIDRKVFISVGLMDEKYFVYYDDTDFIFRAIEKGYKILYLPNLNVRHKVSSSTGAESLFSLYYYTRNRIYFVNKNFSGLRRVIPLAFTLASRYLRYLFFYNGIQRDKLKQAIRDGFRMI